MLADSKQGLRRSLEALEPRTMLSGVELLADINPTSNWDSVREFETVGDTAYFTTDDRVHGYALWRTDGTVENTALVKDVRPDRTDARIVGLTAVGDQLLFFAAADETQGFQLWRSDGTENGTTPIWHPDSLGYWNSPSDWVSTSRGLYFLAIDERPGPEFVYELWRSDGTPKGTVHVKDVQTYGGRARPRLFGEVNGNLLFLADDGEHGKELWTSDGTEEGTTLLVDMVPGRESGFAYGGYSELLLSDHRLFFITDSDPHRPALWTTDGTVEGTIPLGQFAHSLTDFTSLGDVMLFRGRSELTGKWELWRTDGTPPGTVAISVGTEFEGFDPMDLASAGDAVYFNAFDAVHGRELWRSDGTAAGTAMVADLRPGTESSWPNQFVPTSSSMFVIGQREANRSDLWRIELGTLEVSLVFDMGSDSRPNVDDVVGMVNDLVYLTAYVPNYGGIVAITDGSATGTSYLDLNQTTESSFVYPTVLVGDSMVGYSLDNNTRQLILYSVDLTTGEFRHVLEHVFEPRPFGPNILGLHLVNGVLTFLISWSSIAEVWTYDAIENKLQMEVKLPTPPPFFNGCVNVGYSLQFGDGLLFVAQGATGCELWRTDATNENTIRVADSAMLGNSETSFHLSLSGDRIFFTARDPHSPNRSELWTTDATPEGTMPFDQFLGIQSPISGSYALRLNDRWYFVSEDEHTGRELWTSDGTIQGTHLVADIYAGPAGSVTYLRSVAASKLFFVADDGVHGMELWVSDGTSAGTRMLRETIPGPNTSIWQYTTLHGDFMDAFLFSAQGSNGRRQLWRTDGTDAGTIQLSNIGWEVGSTLPRIAHPSHFVDVNGTLFFTASTRGTSNDELWISDGTPAGTRLYHDFDILDAPCRDWIDFRCRPVVRSPLAVNGELFLNVDDRIYGHEPFIVRRSPGDTNFDSVVDLTDLNTVRNNFGRIGENLPGDLTQDGRVDLQDLNEVRNHFSTVPSPGRVKARQAAELKRPIMPASQVVDLLFSLPNDPAEAVYPRRTFSRGRARPVRVASSQH